jgi:putative SOS response-associated peptidase YedK
MIHDSIKTYRIQLDPVGTNAKTKQPFAFTLRSGEPFALRGLWDAWKEANGDWLQSFAIITTDSE